MTTVVVREPAARDVPADTFADITPAPFTLLWAPPALALTFDADLTAAEVLAVQLRAKSLDPNEEAILRAAWQALQANRDYLAGPQNGTTAVVQVERLTRQMNGVIRRIVGFYDGTD